jgi:hypothetical protein
MIAMLVINASYDYLTYLKVTEFFSILMLESVTSARVMVTNRESLRCAHFTGAVSSAMADIVMLINEYY